MIYILCHIPSPPPSALTLRAVSSRLSSVSESAPASLGFATTLAAGIHFDERVLWFLTARSGRHQKATEGEPTCGNRGKCLAGRKAVHLRDGQKQHPTCKHRTGCEQNEREPNGESREDAGPMHICVCVYIYIYIYIYIHTYYYYCYYYYYYYYYYDDYCSERVDSESGRRAPREACQQPS